MGAKVLQILCVSGYRPLASILEATLSSEPTWQIAGRVRSVHAALIELCERPFDLVILDMAVPEGRGLKGMALIREKVPGTPVVLLAPENDRHYEQAAMKNGASACVWMGAIATELVPAVGRVLGS